VIRITTEISFISYYMFYTLHVVEPLRYDSVLIKETNERMNESFHRILRKSVE